MPKRRDIERIMLVGSGPIIIGQACEFDYSGTQACKALKEEGFKVILVNSNPATIMTDPDMADKVYIEPITPNMVAKIIEKERPQALLPTMGGQTALNTAVALAENGTLEKFGVELIGANLQAIKKAEDRALFKEAMQRIGLEVPKSGYAHSLAEAGRTINNIGFPVIIRPSFTLGGTGGSVAYNMEEFEECIDWGLKASPSHEILIEESVIGWKEFELEVMRDLKDNVVIICSIENFDPMGIHTGDSITVAPAQTLTDKEYQIMRDAAVKIIREIGVETGGSNIQFAINPNNGKLVVIEMNPRVSRSSALASKATGFPIAKIAAKLAIGYTLDEIPNDITRETQAAFEPTIDYCVVKFPRFAFEKFPKADQTLTTQMKSVGEVMAIGRTFKEALQKSIRSLEIDRYSLDGLYLNNGASNLEVIKKNLRVASWERVWYIAQAIRLQIPLQDIYELTGIDPWFLSNIREIVEAEKEIEASFSGKPICEMAGSIRKMKRLGFSDRYLSKKLGMDEISFRAMRIQQGVRAVFKIVDTCAAEFQAYTPYLYSTYEEECEANPTDRSKIMILGGGPNRIGQGIEFDYCCVHSAMAFKEEGYETLMVNCNPETVSTDYDTSDRLYFEPLTLEEVMNIVDVEKPFGVVVQFGGQTPLKLAIPLQKLGVNIIGTTPDNIDIAEDRERFRQLLSKLELKQPRSGTALAIEEAIRVAKEVTYPVMVRPSYVLGGRGMEIVYDEESLMSYMGKAIEASPDHPVLIDKFLIDAIEIDVDALCDGENVFVAGIMEHIEEAGVHSGDSACSLPPYSLSAKLIEEIEEQTRALALELKVIGLINIQFAVCKGEIYILEVNPRASRTVPFVSKAIGLPLAKIAAKLMVGKKLAEFPLRDSKKLKHKAIKEAVFPFIKFPGVDPILGPEMKSTGEVMGIDSAFGRAFAKSQQAAGYELPLNGKVFISVKDSDKRAAIHLGQLCLELGFKLIATKGTAKAMREAGLHLEVVNKVNEGRPHIEDHIKNGDIQLVINTTIGKQALIDSYSIRRTALVYGIPYCTTIPGAYATVEAIRVLQKEELGVKAIQDYHLN
ncbi:MAG: carbamoyl-phosphate synthase large subunit [Candidatus Tectomicrobia bacterium]|uniref:Carbamoyl phosphate synthase large chain n=1 Tax=Tectimicrobiota bacterium TaxID=2528274 RepID=A0A933GJZ0_UNCTE|nr:carbamoyl-phosphate synthase large subunit [Candidatus Tectomicrobia bacterium]